MEYELSRHYYFLNVCNFDVASCVVDIKSTLLYYLTDLVVPYVPARSLHSADQNLLTIKRYNLERYGRRCCSVA